MRKSIKKTLVTGIASALLFTGIGTEADAKSKKPNYNNMKGIERVCKQYKKCENTNAYYFKAVNEHVLQDMTFYDAYEVSKQKLKKGKYYEVIYVGENPYKAFELKLSKKESEMMRYTEAHIKAQQKKHKYKVKYNNVYTF